METKNFDKELIISILSGNSTPDEKKRLQKWIQESESNLRIFNEIKLTWLSAAQTGLNFKYNTEAALSNVHNIIKKDISIQSPTRSLASMYNRMIKVAAVLLIVFLAGGLSTWYFLRSVKSSSAICYFEAPLGSRVSAGLPDGTKVWLNAGSKLEYNSNYNERNREVRLTGEGYFKVKTNAAKPFIVKTGEISIKATGTAFNVKAYPDEKQVITTLVEGKIQMEGKGDNNRTFSYSIAPKQKVTYYKDSKLFNAIQKDLEAPKQKKKSAVIEKKVIPLKEIAPIVSNNNVNTVLYTSWKDERWIIDTENLEDLAILLERRFNVKLWFKSSELKKYRFSGTIQNETLEQIFDIMRFTMPIRYNIDKGNVTIDIDKALERKYKAAYLKNKTTN